MPTISATPQGSRAWRARVADAAESERWPALGDGVRLDFTLPPQRWVDLDTLAEATLAGLRDAGKLAARFQGLEALLATRGDLPPPGVTVTAAGAAALRRLQPPGRTAVNAGSDTAPRPGSVSSKRDWRLVVAGAWDARPALAGPVWADVALRTRRSLLGPLEVALDGLEPVLGRDPRGRDWQEFFPNDHLIEWLRVRRVSRGPAVRLRLGPCDRAAPAR